MPDDPHNLQRFVDAQRDTFAKALAEIRAGRKLSHWMWFVFPQAAGLGHSDMARHFAITGLDEARAYLQHAILGPRLREIVIAITATASGDSAEAILGGVDAMKLRSSLELFEAAGGGAEFAAARARFG
jgi:uncharacterized protein (DUF1810 family)